MESLKELFTDEQVESVAQKVLDKTKKKIDEQLSEAFYSEMQTFLNEHFDNFQSGLKQKLLNELADKYVQNPESYQYTDLRARLFEENKETILSSLTDQAITDAIERILLFRTLKSTMFEWRWKDGIKNFILNHWAEFKNDERINNGLLREIENLKSKNNNLQQRINELNPSEY